MGIEFRSPRARARLRHRIPRRAGERSGELDGAVRSAQPVGAGYRRPGQSIDNLVAELLQRLVGHQASTSRTVKSRHKPPRDLSCFAGRSCPRQLSALAPDHYFTDWCDCTDATTSRIAWLAAAAWVWSR
jgi:hypothetical protein